MKGSNSKFFIQFGFAVLLVMGYFTAMFVVSSTFIKNIAIITKEMNVLA